MIQITTEILLRLLIVTTRSMPPKISSKFLDNRLSYPGRPNCQTDKNARKRNLLGGVKVKGKGAYT